MSMYRNVHTKSFWRCFSMTTVSNPTEIKWTSVKKVQPTISGKEKA